MRALERYEIVRTLGRGAAGGVFLVRDRIRPGAPLALKRLIARADDLLRASFEREFSVLASLSLPGVSRVMDFGLAQAREDDPGGPFFTRSWVDGEPLGAWVAQVKPEQVIAGLIGVCQVVAPLHRMGIAHGDLKPGNIIMDAEGEPHVIDFGLARLPTDRVSTGGVGTPAYMAPELLRGESPSVAADVYALSATLWHLLAGSVPFSELGDRALAARLDGALPDIPAELTGSTRRALEVARRGLEADPLSRLPAVRELAAALSEVVDMGKTRSVTGFVTPRPRGHEDVLAQLESRTSDRLAGRAGEQSALLIRAPRGGGASRRSFANSGGGCNCVAWP